MAGLWAEAAAIDQGLGVFDAQAHRKRFGHHVHAAVCSIWKVSRALCPMARMTCWVGMCLSVGSGGRRTPALVNRQVVDVGLELDLAPERFNLGTQLLDHTHQPERAHVGFADVKDFRRRPGCDQLLEHLASAVVFVLDLAMQFAIGESAGTTLAELDIRLGVQDAAPPEGEGVHRTQPHGFASLEHQGFETRLGQDQGREQPARAGANDHGARRHLLRCLGHEACIGRRAFVKRAGRDSGGAGRLVGRHVYVEGVHHADCLPFAGVVTLAGNG